MATRSVLFRAVATPLEEMALGASRVGGPPDLPAGIEWPRAPDGRRLPMVLQLALAEVAEFGLAVPAEGHLWFFAAQLYQWDSPGAINDVPAAIVHARGTLVRHAMPREAADEEYWDGFDVARAGEWRVHESASEDASRPTTSDDWHVLMPVRKYSSAFGEGVPGLTPVLEMRSDYAIRMNWGDAAWATWLVPDEDLAAGRFERAIANVWIG